jgi:hypothetical protein
MDGWRLLAPRSRAAGDHRDLWIADRVLGVALGRRNPGTLGRNMPNPLSRSAIGVFVRYGYQAHGSAHWGSPALAAGVAKS